MMLTSIWERYFLREMCKALLLFMVTFFGLYVLIDYSIHASMYQRADLSFSTIGYTYLCEFSKRLDVLLPFSILIATIKTLCDLTIHHELVALMASGIPLKKLLRPFIMIGLLGTALVFVNGEFLRPTAIDGLKTLSSTPQMQQKKSHKKTAVQQITLPDQSSLLYLNYDADTQSFHHTFWINDFDHIYHAKTLYPFETPPRGESVTYFTRDAEGHLIEKGMTEHFQFHTMPFDKKNTWKSFSVPEELSLVTLSHQLPSATNLDEKGSQIITAFYLKMILPWLCLLAVIAPAPFCIHYTRRLPVFLIYAFCIFGLIAFCLLLSAASVLGTRQVIPPLIAIVVPAATFYATFLFRYLRIV